jgi:hypothetical protein
MTEKVTIRHLPDEILGRIFTIGSEYYLPQGRDDSFATVPPYTSNGQAPFVRTPKPLVSRVLDVCQRWYDVCHGHGNSHLWCMTLRAGFSSDALEINFVSLVNGLNTSRGCDLNVDFNILPLSHSWGDPDFGAIRDGIFLHSFRLLAKFRHQLKSFNVEAGSSRRFRLIMDFLINLGHAPRLEWIKITSIYSEASVFATQVHPNDELFPFVTPLSPSEAGYYFPSLFYSYIYNTWSDYPSRPFASPMMEHLFFWRERSTARYPWDDMIQLTRENGQLKSLSVGNTLRDALPLNLLAKAPHVVLSSLVYLELRWALPSLIPYMSTVELPCLQYLELFVPEGGQLPQADLPRVPFLPKIALMRLKQLTWYSLSDHGPLFTGMLLAPLLETLNIHSIKISQGEDNSFQHTHFLGTPKHINITVHDAFSLYLHMKGLTHVKIRSINLDLRVLTVFRSHERVILESLEVLRVESSYQVTNWEIIKKLLDHLIAPGLREVHLASESVLRTPHTPILDFSGGAFCLAANTFIYSKSWMRDLEAHNTFPNIKTVIFSFDSIHHRTFPNNVRSLANSTKPYFPKLENLEFQLAYANTEAVELYTDIMVNDVVPARIAQGRALRSAFMSVGSRNEKIDFLDLRLHRVQESSHSTPSKTLE